MSAFIRDSASAVYPMAVRLTGSRAEADDLLQECFARACLALADGKIGDGVVAPLIWFRRIVANAAIDLLRRRKLERRTPQALAFEADRTGVHGGDERLALAELERWMAELPEDQRLALVLKEVEGMSVREIAELLETSEGAIEQRLVRARATLRQRRGTDR
jgi:RNA polymerase sigma-70 factor (ECF subfamily)